MIHQRRTYALPAGRQVAFVCLATAALFVNSGGSLSGIWITANSRLGAANASAS